MRSPRAAKRPRAKGPRARRGARGREETPVRPATALVVPDRPKGQGRVHADAVPKEMAHVSLAGSTEESGAEIVLLAGTMERSAAEIGLLAGTMAGSGAEIGLLAGTMEGSAAEIAPLVGIMKGSAVATVLLAEIPEARDVPVRTDPRAVDRVEISDSVTRT